MDLSRLTSEELEDFINKNGITLHSALLDKATEIINGPYIVFTKAIVDLSLAQAFEAVEEKVPRKYTREELLNLSEEEKRKFRQMFGLPIESDFTERLIRIMRILGAIAPALPPAPELAIIETWRRASLPYRLYAFDFDKTLTRIHTWIERGVNRRLKGEEFRRIVENPREDFYQPDFLLALFKAIKDRGDYVAIVTDQYTDNVMHYLSAVKSSDGRTLSDYFTPYGEGEPVNLMGRESRMSKLERIRYIIDSINSAKGERLTLKDVVFYDDDIRNIYQLLQSGKWLGTGIWLAEGPFGERVLRDQIRGDLDECLTDRNSQRLRDTDCIGKNF